MTTAWKRLSVAEFVDRCNWDYVSSSQAIALERSLENWQRLTTQEFFALQNWSGQVVAGSTLAKEVVFDLTLESRQFWQCFNWSGAKVASERVESILEDAQEAIAAVEEFTLNDLSQLF